MRFIFVILFYSVINISIADANLQAKRVTRQTSADQMVQNILQWLQGVYTQNSRRVRQGTLREYLPPSNTQKPRPFQTTPTIAPGPPPPISGNGIDANNIFHGGYPPAGSITPKPPFPVYTSPTTVQTGYPTFRPSFTTKKRPTIAYPTSSYQKPTNVYHQTPSIENGYSTQTVPSQPTRFPTSRPTYIPSTISSPQSPQETPSVSTVQYPSTNPSNDYTTEYQTTRRPAFSTQFSTQGTTREVNTFKPSTFIPTTETFTSQPVTTVSDITTIRIPPISENAVVSTSQPQPTEIATVGDDKHPPHIHAIDVQCSKEMMTISIEFNRVFDGVIYSKGFYNKPECRYVQENSGKTKYVFTVNLNSCGTEFINAFDTQGQSYLENILVLQNEPGIQEVWDTIRAVRCLWEGNLNQALSVALSVGMLSQEIVTFSGDTAMAKLDIQVGKGPFAQPANGLVKIGELMTLVVSISGDPGFDVQVKDCRAKDSTGNNEVALTDDNGCILKPKLFGAFQKTRNTGNTGASIIAYAFFNAFKFPDVMDLMIECNIELCKTDCNVCPDPDQKLEPGRRRRRDIDNSSLADGVTMGKLLKVILPEDISEPEAGTVSNEKTTICMAYESFIFVSILLALLLILSCFLNIVILLRKSTIFQSAKKF